MGEANSCATWWEAAIIHEVHAEEVHGGQKEKLGSGQNPG